MKIKKCLYRIALAVALTLSAAFVSCSSYAKTTRARSVQHVDNYTHYTYEGDYYNDININARGGMNGALRTSLTSLIRPNDFYIYGGSGTNRLSTQLQSADQDPTNSSNMLMFYSRDSVTKTAATVNSLVVWNREHVWCKNRSNTNWKKDNGAEDEAGTDVLHLRPTYPSTNSSRGDTPYGDINKTSPKYYDPDTQKVTNDSSKMLWGYSDGNYFEPLDSVKGDVARIIMYVWTTYTGWVGKKAYEPLNILDIFQSYNTLLRWHTMDKPDALEGRRNDYAEGSIQGNRNPFVDHPDFAWRIFGSQADTEVKEACKEAYPWDGGILLDTTSANLKEGQSITISAELAEPNPNAIFTWTSSDEDVAVVNNGKVTALSAGTTTITVTTEDYDAECLVTVSAIGGSDTFETVNSIASGDTVYLSCNGVSTQYNGPSGTTQDAYGLYSSFTTEPDTDVCPLLVCNGNANNSYAFKITEGTHANKYLAYSGSKNSLKVTTTLDNASSWTVNFDSNNNATITNVAATSRVIWWNVTDPRFACYVDKTDGNSFKYVQLWKVVSHTADVEEYLAYTSKVTALTANETTASDDDITDSLIFSELGLSNYASFHDVDFGSVYFISETTPSSGGEPRYYTSDQSYHISANTAIVIESDRTNISRIEITFVNGSSANLDIEDDNGSFNGNVWTGNSTYIEFDTTANVCISRIDVTHSDIVSVNTVALRFGVSIPQVNWNGLKADNHEISRYGVMFVNKNTLNNTYGVSTISAAYAAGRELASVYLDSDVIEHEDGYNYMFTAKINITSTSNYDVTYCAAPYVVVDDTYYFLPQMEASVSDTAWSEYFGYTHNTSFSEAALRILIGL